MQRITIKAIAVATIPALLLGFAWSLEIKSLGAFLLVVMAVIFGPYMAISYPFPWLMKTGFIIAFVASAFAIAVGFRHRQKLWGLFLVGLGSTVWVFFGLMGLGTGT